MSPVRPGTIEGQPPELFQLLKHLQMPGALPTSRGRDLCNTQRLGPLTSPHRRRHCMCLLQPRASTRRRPIVAMRPVLFHPRGFSPPRRVAPTCSLRACCIPQPAGVRPCNGVAEAPTPRLRRPRISVPVRRQARDTESRRAAARPEGPVACSKMPPSLEWAAQRAHVAPQPCGSLRDINASTELTKGW
jgi:hypothetical protein